MTEEDAKTKWCPFARVPTGAPSMVTEGQPIIAANRLPDGHALGCCFASGCMAWRWIHVPDNRQTITMTLRADGSSEDPPRPLPTDGFCGLAGDL